MSLKSVLDSHEKAIRALSPEHQRLFACACAEHVLPLYERFIGPIAEKQQLASSGILRLAVDFCWREHPSDVDVNRYIEFVSSATPQIDLSDEGDHLQTTLCMHAGCTVLDTLESVKGNNPDAVARTAASALEVSRHACFIQLHEIENVAEPTYEELESGHTTAHPFKLMAEEWMLQKQMVADLTCGEFAGPRNWQETHAKWGRALAADKSE